MTRTHSPLHRTTRVDRSRKSAMKRATVKAIRGALKQFSDSSVIEIDDSTFPDEIAESIKHAQAETMERFLSH